MLAEQLLSSRSEQANGMRRLMLTGGMGGFGIGIACGWMTDGASWPGVFCRACVAALAGGLLLRWWGRVWRRCWEEVTAERLAALEKQPPAPLIATKK